jgi:hypothetical protein
VAIAWFTSCLMCSTLLYVFILHFDLSSECFSAGALVTAPFVAIASIQHVNFRLVMNFARSLWTGVQRLLTGNAANVSGTTDAAPASAEFASQPMSSSSIAQPSPPGLRRSKRGAARALDQSNKA